MVRKYVHILRCAKILGRAGAKLKNSGMAFNAGASDGLCRTPLGSSGRLCMNFERTLLLNPMPPRLIVSPPSWLGATIIARKPASLKDVSWWDASREYSDYWIMTRGQSGFSGSDAR